MDLQRIFITLFLLHVTAASDHEDSWSVQVPAEVRAIEGYPVVLPCSFKHPYHSLHSSMNVVWHLGHSHSSTVLFRCSSLNGSQQCQTTPDQDRRYRLEGNHREHDLSLRISSTGLHDSGRYYCRVELHGHGHYENKMGTRLRVEAPPRILSLSVGTTADGRLRALCRVQGSPLPDIQWMNLEEVLNGVIGPPPLQADPDPHRSSSQLLDVQPGKQYTCAASNPLGKDQATVYILHPEKPTIKTDHLSVPLMLGLALAAKVIFFLSLGAWLIKRKVS